MLNAEEIVTVANRSSKSLNCTWNGRPYAIPAYPQRVALPRIVAVAARYQNPVMGRGTPLEEWSSKSEYLIGIVEDSDPIEPIEQTNAPQRWDTELVNGADTEVIRPRGGTSEVRQTAKSGDVGFTRD